MAPEKSGKVESKNGELLDFDVWYVKKFNEEPSRKNIRKRILGESNGA